MTHSCRRIVTMECTRPDKEIIVYILRAKFHLPSGNFYVIDPRAYIPSLLKNEKDIRFLKQTVRRKIPGYNLNDLLDKLIDKNRESPFLRLKANPLPGFIVDYRGNFSKYFKDNGGGWLKLKNEHPRFMGFIFISLSLPAIDRKSNLALILVSTQSDSEAGYGVLILLKCNPPSIIKEFLLWIS